LDNCKNYASAKIGNTIYNAKYTLHKKEEGSSKGTQATRMMMR
jgi:hypothetical protein